MAAWIGWVLAVAAAVATQAMPFLVLAMLGPILSVVTWGRADASGALRTRWVWPYRATCALLVLACVLGLASGARAEVLDARYLGNTLLAAIFLVIAILTWRAIVAPSPVRIAAIAPALQLGLCVFGTIGAAFELDLDVYWRWLGPSVPLLAMSIASVLGALLSIVAFGPKVPEAQLADPHGSR